ncbi:phosphoribosyltransferase [Candidatus Collierbacteria bacterium]|nr:phosphoribosyltransferase [Candidatus Collierbacteria bacterium]
MAFRDRAEAGRKLALKLKGKIKARTKVVALARGGIPVGAEIAKEVKIPLEIAIVRKIGSPFNKEFAVGAIAEDGNIIIDHQAIERYRIPTSAVKGVIAKEKAELKRRIKLYRKGKRLRLTPNTNIILADDGAATGLTIKAAVKMLRRFDPDKITLALPVCVLETALELSDLVDELICLSTPRNLDSIGSWYKNFKQVSDDQVLKLLKTLTKN